MKVICCILLASLLSSMSFAQDVAAIIKEADRLEVAMQEKKSLEKFKEALKLAPSNAYVLCKLSELSSRVGNREAATSSRDNYYAAAYAYAKKALAAAPQSDEANIVMAIAIGRQALTKSGKEKVKLVKEIKHYADFALKYNKQNFKAWHVLGKWHYEVSNLNFMEKAAVKMFYGGLPEASFKKSIEYYEKAKSLKPGFILNYLELAKAYHQDDQTSKGIALLKQLQQMANQTEDDARIKAEAAVLLKKWQ